MGSALPKLKHPRAKAKKNPWPCNSFHSCSHQPHTLLQCRPALVPTGICSNQHTEGGTLTQPEGSLEDGINLGYQDFLGAQMPCMICLAYLLKWSAQVSFSFFSFFLPFDSQKNSCFASSEDFIKGPLGNLCVSGILKPGSMLGGPMSPWRQVLGRSFLHLSLLLVRCPQRRCTVTFRD